jgi:hypothetical protein
MKRTLMLASVFACHQAMAWTTTPTPTPAPATTPSQATSASTSAARSASQVNASVGAASTSRVSVHNTVTTGGSSSGGSSSGGSGGGGNNVPDLLLPSIVGGNPCTVGVSFGGMGSGGGGGIGASWESHECSLRQSAAILANLGLTRASIETLCRTSMDERWALRNAGWFCKDDVDRWHAEGYSQGGDGAWRR